MAYDTGSDNVRYHDLYRLNTSASGNVASVMSPNIEIADEEEANFSTLAHELSDIALALLLGFAGNGHCRFTYDTDTNGSRASDEQDDGRPRLGESVEGGLLAEEIAKVR